MTRRRLQTTFLSLLAWAVFAAPGLPPTPLAHADSGAAQTATDTTSAATPAVHAALHTAQPTAAEVPHALAGRWEGAIQTPGAELRVLIDLKETDAGAWCGQIDIPAQGARGLELVEIRVADDSVTFAIAGVPGNPSFSGRLTDEGRRIEGDFTQGGATLSFHLERRVDPAATAASALDDLDDLVSTAMETWRVPGLAVAIVKDGEVVVAKGYGLRSTTDELPVTPDTIFAIGSATKAFTTMTVAMLADEGRLDWDEPVTTWLPWFEMKDQFASQRMTPRDLVTHRSGMPRHDLVWYNAGLSRRELVETLRHLEPNQDFRTKFQYQNLMFLTAGFLAGEVAGLSWEDVVRTRIFEPLGMTRSNFSVRESERDQDAARPYTLNDEELTSIAFRDITTVGPAGSINSSIRDMARWAQLHLGRGTVGDRRLVGEQHIADMHRPQMPIEMPPGADPEIVLPAYGLGWFVESYRGRRHVQHGGNIDGFSALVSLFPDENFGTVVLTNLSGNPLPAIVARSVADRLIGLEPIDWIGRLRQRRDVGRRAQQAARQDADIERRTGTSPAHPLEEYAGVYDHPAYGTFAVAHDGDGLTASFHDIPMRLGHWHFDIFRGEVDDPALAEVKLFVQFFTGLEGYVDRLSVPLEPQVEPITFTKRPPGRLTDAGFLERLAGRYAMADNPDFNATVAVTGEAVLTMTVPRQPAYTLEPAYGTTFRLKGLSGFAVRFVLDDRERVTELRLIQPNGVFRLAPGE